MIALVVATPEAVFDRSGQSCPACGRRYVEVFYRPRAQNPSFRCVCIGHGGGCGHVWNLGEHHPSARRKLSNRPSQDEDTRASSENTTGESIMSVAGTNLAKSSVDKATAETDPEVVAEGAAQPTGILPGERPSEAAMRLSEAERAAQPKPSMTKPAPKPSAKKPAGKASKAKATSKGKAKATASKPAAKVTTTAPAAPAAKVEGPVYLRKSRRDQKFILIVDSALFTDENMVTPTRFESEDAALAYAKKQGLAVHGK